MPLNRRQTAAPLATPGADNGQVAFAATRLSRTTMTAAVRARGPRGVAYMRGDCTDKRMRRRLAFSNLPHRRTSRHSLHDRCQVAGRRLIFHPVSAASVSSCYAGWSVTLDVGCTRMNRRRMAVCGRHKHATTRQPLLASYQALLLKFLLLPSPSLFAFHLRLASQLASRVTYRRPTHARSRACAHYSRSNCVPSKACAGCPSLDFSGSAARRGDRSSTIAGSSTCRRTRCAIQSAPCRKARDPRSLQQRVVVVELPHRAKSASRCLRLHVYACTRSSSTSSSSCARSAHTGCARRRLRRLPYGSLRSPASGSSCAILPNRLAVQCHCALSAGLFRERRRQAPRRQPRHHCRQPRLNIVSLSCRWARCTVRGRE